MTVTTKSTQKGRALVTPRRSGPPTRTYDVPDWDNGEQPAAGEQPPAGAEQPAADEQPAGAEQARRPRRRAGPPVWGWLVALLIAALAGIGAGSALALTPQSAPGHQAGGSGSAGPSSSPSRTPSASAGPVAVRRTSSFDPSGGSGITEQNGTFETEHYASADFGGLKQGVGLVLDLGSKHRVRAVRLNVLTGGLGLKLYALDSPPSSTSDLGSPVGSLSSAAGHVTLRDSASAAHRYLVVWVSRLAPSQGKFKAAFTDVKVRG
jgi:hypothetical protein